MNQKHKVSRAVHVSKIVNEFIEKLAFPDLKRHQLLMIAPIHIGRAQCDLLTYVRPGMDISENEW